MESLLWICCRRVPLFVSSGSLGRSSVQHQSVRWKKPMWVPMAKSKEFLVNEPRALPTPEQAEFDHLMYNYDLFNKSLWSYQKKLYDESQAVVFSEEKFLQDEEEYENILLENELENSRVAKRREESQIQEWKLIEDKISTTKMTKDEEAQFLIEENEKKLKMELERLESSINKEDLDTYIDKILSVDVDHNFAIDKIGNRIEGRYNNNMPTVKS